MSCLISPGPIGTLSPKHDFSFIFFPRYRFSRPIVTSSGSLRLDVPSARLPSARRHHRRRRERGLSPGVGLLFYRKETSTQPPEQAPLPGRCGCWTRPCRWKGHNVGCLSCCPICPGLGSAFLTRSKEKSVGQGGHFPFYRGLGRK